MKKNNILIMILVILGTIFIQSTNFIASKTQQDDILIGILAPMAITQGIDEAHAAELAVQEINDAGRFKIGTKTYTFTLIKETTSGTTGFPDATTAAISYNKLAYEDGVVAVIGGFRTEVMQTFQLGGHLDRPFLSIGTTFPLISPYL